MFPQKNWIGRLRVWFWKRVLGKCYFHNWKLCTCEPHSWDTDGSVMRFCTKGQHHI